MKAITLLMATMFFIAPMAQATDISKIKCVTSNSFDGDMKSEQNERPMIAKKSGQGFQFLSKDYIYDRKSIIKFFADVTLLELGPGKVEIAVISKSIVDGAETDSRSIAKGIFNESLRVDLSEDFFVKCTEE